MSNSFTVPTYRVVLEQVSPRLKTIRLSCSTYRPSSEHFLPSSFALSPSRLGSSPSRSSFLSFVVFHVGHTLSLPPPVRLQAATLLIGRWMPSQPDNPPPLIRFLTCRVPVDYTITTCLQSATLSIGWRSSLSFSFLSFSSPLRNPPPPSFTCRAPAEHTALLSHRALSGCYAVDWTTDGLPRLSGPHFLPNSTIYLPLTRFHPISPPIEYPTPYLLGNPPPPSSVFRFSGFPSSTSYPSSYRAPLGCHACDWATYSLSRSVPTFLPAQESPSLVGIPVE